MPKFLPLLHTALQQNELSLSPLQIEKLDRYLSLMLEWNRVFNLTAITSPKEMVYLHIIDSLLVHPFLQGKRFLDVGSGAGLPGIPLAILNPEQKWVLLDKNGKKTNFLTQAIAELDLPCVTATQSRAESFQPELCFDAILSRAYSSLSTFLETTAHLLCPDGLFIAMKGKYPTDELAEIPSRFLTQNVTRLALKGMPSERHVVCLKINK